MGRAAALLTRASADGSAIATYNLGVLAQNGVAGSEAEAIGHFRKAAELGEPRGYQAAAILLDEGRGHPHDPAAAADLLLRGVATDYGEAFSQLTEHSGRLAARDGPRRSGPPDKAVRRLYDGEIDRVSGPHRGSHGRDSPPGATAAPRV